MNTHIHKIKIFFFIVVIVIVLFIAGGSFFLRNNPYLTQDYALGQLAFFKYKLEYLSQKNNSLAVNAYSVINDPETYAAPNAYSESIPVLVYHGIIKDETINSNDESDITIDKFKDQMFTLKRAGYETITTNELYEYLRGERRIPEKSFVLTFDDGRFDSIKHGDPILRALDYEAVMFVIAKYSIDESNNYYANKEKLLQVSKSGRWDLQSHTNNSHISAMVSPTETGHILANKMFLPESNRIETESEYIDRIKKDLWDSRDKLETLIDKKVSAFAFPFGDFAQGDTNLESGSETLLKEVSSIYNLGFYQYGPVSRFRENYHVPSNEKDTFFMVRRMHPNHLWNGEDLLSYLSKTHSKSLPYTDTFTTDQGWISSWGEMGVENNNLLIQAKGGESGGAVILDGTRLWKDYVIKARVITPEKNNIYVWARFQDDNNNAGCNFGEGFTHIEHTVDGVKRVLKGTRAAEITLPSGEFSVEIRVKGRTMSCVLNGKEIVTTQFLNPKLSQGGIGFKTWDAVTTKGSLNVRELLVTAE